MSRLRKVLLLGLAICALPISAWAEDVVAVRFLGGYPPSNRSFETISLKVSRLAPPVVGEREKQAVDRFFDQVAAVLSKHDVTKDWQLAIPDAPSIEIDIEIGGKKLKLVSCHISLERGGNYLVTETGGRAVPDKERASVLAQQSEAFRSRRLAFETIVDLTLERARAQLAH